MAIQVIYLGKVPNDGTGDGIRTAFIKINNNFEKLYSAFDSINGENIGGGAGIFSGKDPVSGVLQFKTLVPGNNIQITETDTTLTIDTLNSSTGFEVITDNGTLDFNSAVNIVGGTSIDTSVQDGNVVVSLGTIESSLNFDNNVDIINVNRINGVEWDTTLGKYTSFDFGGFSDQTSNILEFIIEKVGVDFGSVIQPVAINVDLGGFTSE